MAKPVRMRISPPPPLAHGGPRSLGAYNCANRFPTREELGQADAPLGRQPLNASERRRQLGRINADWRPFS
jgi:hypothetical protein